MYYLYENHLGGIYFTDEEFDYDMLYCEQCNDSDWLMFSFSDEEELRSKLLEECADDDEYYDVDEYIESIMTDFREKFGDDANISSEQIQITPADYIADNGLNANIGVNVLDDNQMRSLGFTDRKEDTWYFCRGVGNNISFNLSIRKDGSEFSIDVLDEDFLQPYDYQKIIMDGGNFDFVNNVYYNVEDVLEELTDAGILYGHVRGEYV